MDVIGYHIKSSFSGKVEIEAKLERDKCIVDVALETVSVDNSQKFGCEQRWGGSQRGMCDQWRIF